MQGDLLTQKKHSYNFVVDFGIFIAFPNYPDLEVNKIE